MPYLNPEPLTMKANRLAGRPILVTAAPSGIGEAAVALFAREGACARCMADDMPVNDIARPQDMARAALFLRSEDARWTTGTVLPCEGGASAD